MDNKHYFIIGILILTLIGGGIWYYNTQETPLTTSSNHKSNKSGGVVLGDSNELTQTGIGSNSNTTSNASSETSGTITSGEAYYAKVNELRKPINDGFDDMNSKIKYKTLFWEDDAQKAIDDLIGLVSQTTDTFNNLDIDKKFTDANAKEIESLGLLQEAMEAFNSYYHAKDQTEQQKYSDIYSYKIDQSNKVLENVAIPK